MPFLAALGGLLIWMVQAFGVALITQVMVLARLSLLMFVGATFFLAVLVAVLEMCGFEALEFVYGLGNAFHDQLLTSGTNVRANINGWWYTMSTSLNDYTGLAQYLLPMRLVMTYMASIFAIAFVILAVRYAMGVLGRNT